VRPDWANSRSCSAGHADRTDQIFEASLFNTATLLMAPSARHQWQRTNRTQRRSITSWYRSASPWRDVRVGLAAGAGDRAGVRRAGTSAVAVSAAFMSVCAVAIALSRHQSPAST